MREAGSATRATLEAAYLREHLALPEAQVVGDTEALKHATAAGLGIACLSPWSVRAEVEAGHLRTLRLLGVELRRPLSILTRTPAPKPARDFAAYLQTTPPPRQLGR